MNFTMTVNIIENEIQSCGFMRGDFALFRFETYRQTDRHRTSAGVELLKIIKILVSQCRVIITPLKKSNLKYDLSVHLFMNSGMLVTLHYFP